MNDMPVAASLPPVSVAFPEEHYLHPSWPTTHMQDSVPGHTALLPTSGRSSTSGGGNPYPLLDHQNNNPLWSNEGGAADLYTALPQLDGVSEFDYDVAAMDSGLSIYDNFSWEYMYSLLPAATTYNNASEPAWQFSADGVDDRREGN
jgi:hypothetical protein